MPGFFCTSEDETNWDEKELSKARGKKHTAEQIVNLDAASRLVDSILELDRKAPRKQRHTARRIYDRIRAEVPGCTPAERTVRQYVERRKHALGLAEHEVFVPLSYAWGVEAQVDWYEAYADLDVERIKLQAFEMRSMASGAAFHGVWQRFGTKWAIWSHATDVNRLMV